MSKTISITVTDDDREEERPKCFCGLDSVKLKVKKQTPNYGRTFYKCYGDGCKFFKWQDTMDEYNPEVFKNGACFRCGRFRCDATDCEETFDVFGNIIPEDAYELSE